MFVKRPSPQAGAVARPIRLKMNSATKLDAKSVATSAGSPHHGKARPSGGSPDSRLKGAARGGDWRSGRPGSYSFTGSAHSPVFEEPAEARRRALTAS